MHCDLKPSNILIDKNGCAWISDFGTSQFEESDRTQTTATGTVHYAAPEMFEDNGYTNKVDVFSFGSVLYEILAGKPVFPPDMMPFPVLRQLHKKKMPEIPEDIQGYARDLIKRCWSFDPAKRPSFDQILAELRQENCLIGFMRWKSSDVMSYVEAVLSLEHRIERKSRR
jgi:serine/threonine protein kinase